MNDESSIAAGITILGIVLPWVVPFAIWFFLRRRIPGLSATLSIRNQFLFRLLGYQWVRIPVSLFIGLMIASAGGALHPPLLTVAAPVLCDGGMDITSRSYSYKPGQSGTSHTIRCERQGRVEEVTLRAIGVSALIYGAGAWVLLTLLHLLRPKRRQAENPAGLGAGLGGLASADDMLAAPGTKAEERHPIARSLRPARSSSASAGRDVIEWRCSHPAATTEGAARSRPDQRAGL